MRPRGNPLVRRGRKNDMGMSQESFFREIVRRLGAANVPFMIVGSVASGTHGQPRETRDVNIVIDPTPAQLGELLSIVDGPFRVSAQGATDALTRRVRFNVTVPGEGWKAEILLREDRPYSVEEF